MPGLSVYRIEQAEQWDDIVRSFQNYDVYYLLGYAKAFQLHGDGEPLLFFYNDEGIRAINVVMKRDIADAACFKGVLQEGRYFDFATPYGYGGWLIEGTGSTAPLFAAYADWSTGNKMVSEFVRFHPLLKNHRGAKEFYNVIALGSTVSMDLGSPEIIWSNLSSKNRNMIRKAQNNGLRIYNGRSPELLEIFRTIYNMTMDRDHASPYYYFSPTVYESILQDLAHNAQVFYAQLADGTVVAASILLAANGRLSYHLSGSIKEYQGLAPTNLLLYEAALWGCANGCKTLHLGGGIGAGEDSLFRFKKSFYRKEPCQYYIGEKIFQQEAYRWLVRQRQDMPASDFFPLYRAR